MNNTQFLNGFAFLRYENNHSYSFTGYSKGTGAPAHYIVQLVKGSARIKTRLKTVTIAQGEAFYIPKGVQYQSFWEMDKDNQLVFDSFGFQNFPIPDGYQYALQKVPCTAEDLQLLQHIRQTATVNCATVGSLYSFLGNVMPKMEYDTKHRDSLVEIALDYMRNHTEFYIADVARYCGVSESTLYGVFKKAYNKTPVEMKQKILCEKAAELLTTTNLSVEEISRRLSFSSSSYFRKVFGKHIGQTPLQVRKTSKFQL